MSEPRSLRSYDFVDRPYEGVRELLHRDPLKLMQRATTSAAATRASSLIASLHLQVAGFEIGVEVRVFVRGVRDERLGASQTPMTRVELTWEAKSMAPLFPTMLAEITAQPLSSTETQVEIEGSYCPPLGPVGVAIDVAFGNRLGEAVVTRLLEDLVEQIRAEIPAGPRLVTPEAM